MDQLINNNHSLTHSLCRYHSFITTCNHAIMMFGYACAKHDISAGILSRHIKPMKDMLEYQDSINIYTENHQLHIQLTKNNILPIMPPTISATPLKKPSLLFNGTPFTTSSDVFTLLSPQSVIVADIKGMNTYINKYH